jgi:hypothetical protein
MMSYRDFKGGMRPGQNKRSRNRNNGGGQQHQNNNGNRPRLPNRMQTFDSSGPNIKIRGNAYQVFERYVALAREASSAGDRIAAENYYQHAEHYFRIMNADGQGNPMAPRPMTPADTEMNGMMDGDGDGNGNNNNMSQGEAETVSTQPPQHQPPQNNDPDSQQGQ